MLREQSPVLRWTRTLSMVAASVLLTLTTCQAEVAADTATVTTQGTAQGQSTSRVKTSDKLQQQVMNFVKGRVAPPPQPNLDGTQNGNQAINGFDNQSSTSLTFAQSTKTEDTKPKWSDVTLQWNSTVLNPAGVKWVLTNGPAGTQLLTGFSPTAQATPQGAGGTLLIPISSHLNELPDTNADKPTYYIRVAPVNAQMQPLGLPSNTAKITYVKP